MLSLSLFAPITALAGLVYGVSVDLSARTASNVASRTDSFSNTFTYQACYADDPSARTLPHAVDNPGNTIDSCIFACSYRNFTVAGLEYYGECFCDVALPVASPISAPSCYTPCNGDATQLCGGPGALSIYSITRPTLGIFYEDCFKDPLNVNLFTAQPVMQAPSAGMTVGICTEGCWFAGYKYAALSSGTTCTCGSAAPSPTTLTNAFCNQQCSGDNSEICGGVSGSSSIYYVNLLGAAGFTTESNFVQSINSVVSTASVAAAVAVTASISSASVSSVSLGSIASVSSASLTSLASAAASVSSVASVSSLSLASIASTIAAGAFQAQSTQSFTDSRNRLVSYDGCYQDSITARVLSGVSVSNPAMTIALCQSTCAAVNAPFFGLEFAIECYCGSASLGSLTTAPFSECSMTCGGDGTRKCGGPNRIQIYHTATTAATPVLITTVTPAGYTATHSICANAAPASVHGSLTSSSLTLEQCTTFCGSAGFLGFGIQNNLCQCANLAGASFSTGTCNVACAGDTTEVCGGASSFNIYSIVAATPVPAINIAPTTGSYLGCYQDSWARILPTRVSVSGASNANSCLSACATAGFKYAGVQFGGECWCGASAPSTSLLIAPNLCVIPCSVSTVACGGNLALLLYSNIDANVITAPSLTTVSSHSGYTLTGCFADTIGLRVLNHTQDLHATDTPEACIDACQTLGYELAGVEFGSECYCDSGLSLPGYAGSALTDGSCNMPCSGDATKYCGAGNRIQVYTSSVARGNKATLTVNGHSWKYLACWGEPLPHGSDNRGLPIRVTSASTVEACLTAGDLAGYAYCGLEYGGECWCNSNQAGGGQIAESYCTQSCNGNPWEFCGGDWTLSYYTSNSALSYTPI